MNFLFNWKNIIGGSDSDGFEDDFPDCISQGEFEDDDNDYATNYAESLMSSSQSEFEDDAEDFMVNYTESLTSNWNEFEDDAEDFVVNYAESLMSNQNSIRETDENFLDDDRIVSHYNGYEDTDEDYDEEGALPSCYFEDGDYLKPQNYQETEYHDCLLDIEGRDENNISKGKSKEKIKQGDAVGSKTEGKRHRKLKMQQLEGIFLERIPVRNVCGNLFYFDGRSYKRADAQELKTLLRSVLPQKVIEAISGMFQYHEVVEYIKINPELTLDAREFPYRKEKNYISFKNMVVDAKTMKLYKHQSEFPLFFRIRAEFQKEPDATPVFDGFLAAISGEDKEIECLILEMLGYLCLHSNDAKVFFVLGQAPDSGKSIFIEFINLLFDEECVMHTALQDMGDKFAMTDLPYKAINTHADLSAGKIKEDSVGVVKNLTGDSTFCYNKKFADPSNTIHHMHMVFGTNAQISLKTQDEAFWSRMIIVPFNYSVPKAEQNKNLLGELIEERDAIISKAVKAVSKVIARNYPFTIPKESQRMWIRWSGNVSEIFQEIMDELIEITNNNQDKIAIEDLYSEYVRANMAKGFVEMTYHEFLGNMQLTYGLEKKKTRIAEKKNPVSCFLGVRKRKGSI